MNVLITGATGFIGRNLSLRLAERGHRVVALVRRRSAGLEEKGIESRVADFEDADDMRRAISGSEVIFHLAALRGEWGWTAEQLKRVNVEMTGRLLDAAAATGARQFIYCSSVSVHGRFARKPADENYIYAPVSGYGESKVEAEKLVRSYNGQGGLATTIIRPVITYGRYDFTGMVTKLIKLIHSGRYLTVGSGENTVHLAYIDDLCDGLIIAASREEAAGETFILAGERPITINELVSKICSLLHKRVPKFHVPLLAAKCTGLLFEVAFRMGGRTFMKEPLITRSKVDIMTVDRAYNIEKARSLLGYRPRIDYDEGLLRTVDWMRADCLI